MDYIATLIEASFRCFPELLEKQFVQGGRLPVTNKHWLVRGGSTTADHWTKKIDWRAGSVLELYCQYATVLLMKDTDENRIAHLHMIQDVVKRLSSNSFLVKGWSITLVSALVALAITSNTIEIAYLGVALTIMFWGLDAYWLRQERLFRALYDHVRTAPPASLEGEVFSMNTKVFSSSNPNLLAAMRSPTIWVLYSGLLVVAIAVIIIFNNSVIIYN